jgi:hypothetical protein
VVTEWLTVCCVVCSGDLVVLGGVDGTGEYLSDIYTTTPVDATHHGQDTHSISHIMTAYCCVIGGD